jgi:hypothetical protein
MSGVRQCRPPLVQEVRYVPAQIGNQHSPYSFYIFLCRNNPGHYAMLGSPFPSYHHRYPKQKFTPSLCLPPTKPHSPCPPHPTTPPASLHRTKHLIPKPQKPRITILPHCLADRSFVSTSAKNTAGNNCFWTYVFGLTERIWSSVIRDR